MALRPLPVWKDTFRVNSRTPDYQYNPDVVGLSNGNFLVVWTDANDTTANGDGLDIVGQLYDAFGEKIGGTMVLNEGYGTDRAEYLPKVAATDDGGFALTYTYASGTDYDQLYRRFDASGDSIDGFDRFVVSDSSGDPFPSSFQMTQRPDGSSVIVYRHDNGSDEDILARIVFANGIVSGPITIREDNDPTGNSSDPINPMLTTLSDGRVIIALREKDGADNDVEAWILNTDNTLGIGFTVNSDDDEDVDVSVAALSDGGWIVTWRVGDNINGQIYNSNNTTRGGELDLTPGAEAENRNYARVIGLQDGGFALGWVDYTDTEISVRAFDANGDQATRKTDLQFKGVWANNLDLSETADGRILLTWDDYNNDNYNNTEVFSAIMDPRGDTFRAADDAITVARLEGGRINGTASRDDIYGMNGRDDLRGAGGNDRLFGGIGGDTLEGGTGNDRIKAGRGNDKVEGGRGNDLLWGADNHDTVKGDGGKDTIWGGDGDDRLFGGGANDVVYGDDGNDRLFGGADKDKLFAGKGNDRIYGGDGEDKIKGEGGNDRIWGGGDADLIRGEGGADTFIYTAASDSRTGDARRDTIFFFDSDTDLIDLSGIDANTKRGGNQAFDYIGTSGFSGDAGELRVRVDGDDLVILADRNGDRRADFEINLENPLNGIVATDFIL